MSEVATVKPSAPSSRANWHAKGPWVVFALALLVAPWVFSSNLSVNLLGQMCIAMVACLSYNILLGQGGMLSFGHAVFSGLGAYVAIHTLNMAGGGQLPIPVSLIPLVGALGGLFFAALLGYVTVRKSGTPFAMITLGIGELVFAMSLMFSGFFGGEAGISSNRVVGEAFLGITFGPPRQIYYLIAAYTFLSVLGMYMFTQTPLGRVLNAVRDNPERVEFIGYNAERVRYMAFIVSGFFAGVAGGLAALLFELVTAEVVGAARSGAYLLFTFLGGATLFYGPIIGGVLLVVMSALMSEWTNAWLLYLGLTFVFMVMYVPGGIASLISMLVQVAKAGQLGQIGPKLLLTAAGGLMAFLGSAAMIEMVYHLQLATALGDEVKFMGMMLHAKKAVTWIAAGAVFLVGVGWFEWARRRLATVWHSVHADMDAAANAQQRGAA
jgi:branched-chain amino acid transport system permease protein